MFGIDVRAVSANAATTLSSFKSRLFLSPLRARIPLLPFAGKRDAAVESQLGDLFGHQPDEKDQRGEYDQYLGGRAVAAVEHEDLVEAVARLQQER